MPTDESSWRARARAPGRPMRFPTPPAAAPWPVEVR
jgi:hypothetical protein